VKHSLEWDSLLTLTPSSGQTCIKKNEKAADTIFTFTNDSPAPASESDQLKHHRGLDGGYNA